METPLNLAHRCQRKAEYYVNDHRFKEAIDSHLKAAQHISEALMTTSCDKMKSSLETQKEFHLSQENVLKQREICENQRLLNYRQELINRKLLREKFGYNSDNNCNQAMATNSGSDSGSSTESNTKVDTNKSNVMSEILDTMSEHDSLLQFLIHKREVDEHSDGNEATILKSESSDSLYKSGSKKPKDDKTIIEELQTVNEKLRLLVFQLFGELELSQKDNSLLRSENNKLKNENRQQLSSGVLELPPLEPPPTLLY